MTAVTSKPNEPRGARRKRETRSRLLKAAMTLMAVRGKDSVSINELTDAADVGFGSFYNHFKSKDDIYNALMAEVFNEFGIAIEEANKVNDDPADIISFAVQCVLLRSKVNPLWGQFLLRTAFSVETIVGGMGQYMLKDLERGVSEKRFVVSDPLMSFVSVGSTVMGAISIQHNLASQSEIVTALAEHAGYNVTNIPQRTAATVLQILGINEEEANAIASKPLLDVDFVALP